MQAGQARLSQFTIRAAVILGSLPPGRLTLLAAMVVQSRAARQITECVLDAISRSRGIVIKFAVIRCGLAIATSERSSTPRMVPKYSGSSVVLYSRIRQSRLVYLSMNLSLLCVRGSWDAGGQCGSIRDANSKRLASGQCIIKLPSLSSS
ncbi:hypothetical protein BKA58DRAFT_372668 [Alternaria rosae]|uniref:uncharacterized protein n=1 Tax=Alternaria rosae TaxID=1187941 RepID=UPI001E8D6455|nr:uncharacterized protein BKA58DRAFT_372668 [Alternaria rosae]KAH6882069.1 hypothetical protein BKA58DRAFT_372668 [Alternaria rosae]